MMLSNMACASLMLERCFHFTKRVTPGLYIDRVTNCVTWYPNCVHFRVTLPSGPNSFGAVDIALSDSLRSTSHQPLIRYPFAG
jgi:hypothetical protein